MYITLKAVSLWPLKVSCPLQLTELEAKPRGPKSLQLQLLWTCDPPGRCRPQLTVVPTEMPSADVPYVQAI